MESGIKRISGIRTIRIERRSLVGIPQYYEMHKPMLQLLSDGQVHTFKEIKAHVAGYFHLTEEDMAEPLPSGRQTYFSNRIGWARTYLKKAGLLEPVGKGTYLITEEGKKVVLENPEVIDRAYLMRYPSFKTFVGAGPQGKNEARATEDETETPDDAFENAFKKINQSLADDILAEVMKLSPTAFEKMVLDLMAKMGYGTFANAATTTAITGDEGIDGIIMEDKLGFDLIYVQVKRWSPDHLVGRPEVQGFVGAIAGKGGKGLFVTTSGFTRQAIEYAKNQHVILMDGERMAYYMIEHNFGVSTKKVFEIKAIDSDLFEEYQDESL